MILTGPEIAAEVEAGAITIEPFDRKQLNPNSYNYRLGPELREVKDLPWDPKRPSRIVIPSEGFVLEPGRFYLGATQELIGSDKYAISLIGRSTVARLGLFLQVTADLGHQGTKARWTLEMKAVQRLRVYAGMEIGQVSFWVPQGEPMLYKGKYAGDEKPRPSRLASEF